MTKAQKKNRIGELEISYNEKANAVELDYNLGGEYEDVEGRVISLDHTFTLTKPEIRKLIEVLSVLEAEME